MRIRLWAQIGITLAINLALLVLLVGAYLFRENQKGIESIWFNAARERIRALGAVVEAEFPSKSTAERNALLAAMEKQYHVTLAVYEESGELKAGPDLGAPPSVIKEINTGAAKWPDRTKPFTADFLQPPRPEDRAMFLVKQDEPSRYWIGVNTPIAKVPGVRPVRHVLVVITSSLLLSPLFVEWTPWAIGAFAALLVSILCWTPFVRRLTRSIETVRTAAADIAAGKFDVDVSVKGGDELEELGVSVKRMADQLSRLVEGEARFVADVAHELCAPIARIQLAAALLELRASPAEAEKIQRLKRHIEQMSALVSDSLSLTKGAARTPDLAAIPLAEVVQGVVDQEGGIGDNLCANVDPSIEVIADREYLQRAIGSVLRNAVRSGGSKGPIRIFAERQTKDDAQSTVRLRVEDSGPGLPEGDFETHPTPVPLEARTSTADGIGLGLAIVRNCIEACGGSVVCTNLRPSGLAVDIQLRAA